MIENEKIKLDTNEIDTKETHTNESNIEEFDFTDSYLNEDIVAALKALGYKTPTKIQQSAIPFILQGKNVIARSRTGTGKTAAFAIPICEKVVWEENLPQALILEPSRELAVQVSDEIFRIGRKKRLKVPAVFGGFPIDKQIQTLRQKAHIVVGTPGRIMDLVRRESLKLSKVKYLVIDEADLMLDMGFLDEVKEIISQIPEDRIMLLFSATLENKVQNLIDDYITDAVYVLGESEPEQKNNIEQVIYEANADNKYYLFKRTLIKENPESCMVFCGTREMVNVLFQKLRRDRIFCGMLHGEMEQRDRLKTVDAFRRGGFRYLIATDVAARGIDFDNITHVINYDFPTGRETYVHRIGRTGRNGKTGKAISLLCEDDKNMFKMVQEYTEKELSISQFTDVDEAQEKAFWAFQRQKPTPKAEKGAKLESSITRLSIGGGRKSKMRAVDIVGTVCSIPGITAEDIGIIDVRESITYVEILNNKGKMVFESLQNKTIKGKPRKVSLTRKH